MRQNQRHDFRADKESAETILHVRPGSRQTGSLNQTLSLITLLFLHSVPNLLQPCENIL
jgi:hypothetical protein